MEFKSGPTEFAPGERSGAGEIERQRSLVSKNIQDNPVLKTVLNSIFDKVLILDRNRQAVFANESMRRFLKVKGTAEIIGYRPGELFKCANACSAETGCGTTRLCRFCGAAKAVLSAQEARMDIEECVIVQKDGNVIDLAVAASPVSIEGEPFVIFAMRDITDKKHKEILEGVFFHDVLNIATVISTLAELIKMDLDKRRLEFTEKIILATRRLIDEIQWQDNLLKAQRSELEVDVRDISSLDIINQIVALYYDIGNFRGVKIEIKAEDAAFKSDPVLLRRVLGNLLKNAIEASSNGQAVTIECKKLRDGIEFSVHNKSVIPDEVQTDLFRRTLSTKGKGRGFGTYSIKLFTERYLKGHVSFKSHKKEGTTFYVNLPLSI